MMICVVDVANFGAKQVQETEAGPGIKEQKVGKLLVGSLGEIMFFGKFIRNYWKLEKFLTEKLDHKWSVWPWPRRI